MKHELQHYLLSNLIRDRQDQDRLHQHVPNLFAEE